MNTKNSLVLTQSTQRLGTLTTALANRDSLFAPNRQSTHLEALRI
jgi:hypothetical protein